MFQTEKMSAILKELKLKNFKCFKSEQTIYFKKITILTGANSSGKSSVLNSILGLIQSKEFPFKFSTNGKYVNMGDFKDVSNKHTAKEIKLDLKFFIEDLKQDCSFNTIWINDKINSLPKIKVIEFIIKGYYLKIYLEKGMYYLDFNYNPRLDPVHSPESGKELEQEVIKNFQKKMAAKFKNSGEYKKELKEFKIYTRSMYTKTNIKKYKIGSDIDDYKDSFRKIKKLSLDYLVNGLIERIVMDYDNNINVISSFRLHPDRTYLEKSKDKLKIDKFGEGYLDQIILWEKREPKKIAELTKIMKQMGLIHSISTHRMGGGRYETMITTKENGTETPVFDVGFGISQFLPVIVADLQLDNSSTLLIAEPEIHLHPNVQAEFATYLVNQIEKKQKNYIIETHSEYLLNRLRLEIVKGNLKEEDLSVYFLENDGEDITINDLKFTKEGSIKDAPNSFFDTYMIDLKDIALSVEL
ncbi:MAG: DUF3696 domain-containing protein [Ginsengibacter sp.]